MFITLLITLKGWIFLTQRIQSSPILDFGKFYQNFHRDVYFLREDIFTWKQWAFLYQHH